MQWSSFDPDHRNYVVDQKYQLNDFSGKKCHWLVVVGINVNQMNDQNMNLNLF